MSAYAVLFIGALIGGSFYLIQRFTIVDYNEFWPRVIIGIIGFSFMLLMHIYSIRKRKRDWQFFNLFPYKLTSYLSFHIILATTGVVAIFFHAIGSYDSTIAWISFLSMFLVWMSGFIGRYIFVKIPKDNVGYMQEKDVITSQLEKRNRRFIDSMAENSEDEFFQRLLISYLGSYGKSLHLLHKRSDSSFFRFFKNFIQIFGAFKYYRKSKSNLLHGNIDEFKELDEKERKAYTHHLNLYSKYMREILLLHFEMEFNDILKGLFKNWHDIHVPLTYLFYTTAVLHIIVVAIFATYAK